MGAGICRFFLRGWLIQKRLLVKYSFLLLLVLPLLFAAGLGRLAGEESGIAAIALYLPENDPAAEQVRERLLGRESVFRFLSCESKESALGLVETGEADAAWLFSDEMGEEIRELAKKRRVRPLVKVVERRDSVPLILAREVLSAAVYPTFSYAVYENYVVEQLGYTELDEETIRRTYESVAVSGNLFQMVYHDGSTEETEGFSYVQAPLRGILAIWLTFLGLAAVLFFMQDEERGVYGRLSGIKHLFAFYGVGAVFLLDGTAILLLCCRLSGVFTEIRREVVCAAVFACCVLAFSNLLRLLCRTPRWIGALFLPLLAAMLVLCPVFFELHYFRAGKLLLPPRYYLYAVHNDRYLYGMAVYSALLVLVSAVIQRLQNRGS